MRFKQVVAFALLLVLSVLSIPTPVLAAEDESYCGTTYDMYHMQGDLGITYEMHGGIEFGVTGGDAYSNGWHYVVVGFNVRSHSNDMFGPASSHGFLGFAHWECT